MTKKQQPPARKWRLTAYPPGPRFVGNRSTAVWSREYFDLAALNRAAPHVHKRFPDATLLVMPFVFKGWCWGGDSRDDWTIHFCTLCNGRLNWTDDQWHCPRCGNEWHDEQVRPQAEKEN